MGREKKDTVFAKNLRRLLYCKGAEIMTIYVVINGQVHKIVVD